MREDLIWWCQRKLGLWLFQLSMRVYPGIGDTVRVLAEAHARVHAQSHPQEDWRW